MSVKRHSTWLRKLTISVGAIVLITVASVYLFARFEQYRALELVTLLSDVTPGVTSQASVQHDLEHKSISVGTSNPCAKYQMGNCDQFGFTNAGLVLLHISSRKKMALVTLDYQNGLVISKSAQFLEEPRIGVVTRQLITFDKTQPGDAVPPGRQVIVDMANSESAIVNVSDDQSVPQDQRRKDWQVDFSCLSKFGACMDPRVILPGAFSKK